MKLRFPAAALVAGLLFTCSAIAQAPVVLGERSRSADPAPATLRLAPIDAPRVELPPVSDFEVETVRDANRRGAAGLKPQVQRRVAVGVVRGAGGEIDGPPVARLAWTAVAGGHAAQVAVTSPEAGSLRLAIDLSGVPTDVELAFVGSGDPRRVEGPVRVGDIRDRTVPWWTPVTEGSTQTVEIFVPQRHDPRAIGGKVVRASHLFTTIASGFTKRLQDIGSAGSCNIDVPCSALNSNPLFQQAAESVAQMVFNDGAITALCTGTLLNDQDAASQVPWFYTANHCFENDAAPFKTVAQMQTVANTLTTLWGFQASSCGSTSPRSNWTQVFGGATVLYNNDQSDGLFLRLNGTPPSYAYYAGWDANALAAGSPVITLHHPNGDLKKVSEGSVRGYQILADVGRGGGSFIEVLWSRGTTERGSSGGGLYTAQTTPSGTQYVLRGGLWGGTALCTNTTGTDNFSRFDTVYPNVSQYLGATTSAPTATPTQNYTDLWWDPSQDGWGLNLVQHDSHVMFGVWYTYDGAGKRTWFVFSSGTWTDANTYAATLQSVTGPPQSGGTFDPSLVRRGNVGTATLRFSDRNNGTFSWSVNGQSGVKNITRYAF